MWAGSLCSSVGVMVSGQIAPVKTKLFSQSCILFSAVRSQVWICCDWAEGWVRNVHDNGTWSKIMICC